MISLRPYQAETIDRLRTAMRSHKSVLLCSPTGSGKTVMFSYMVSGCVSRNIPVLVLVHRRELMRQIEEKFSDFGIAYGLQAENNEHLVQIGTVQTIGRRLDRLKTPEIIIVDEAHHVASDTYRRVLNTYHDARIIGVTATPERLDGAGLSEFFHVIVYGPTPESLFESGYLCKPRYFAPPSVLDLSSVRKTAGDYNKHDLQVVMDKPCIYGDAIINYQRFCEGQPAIAFCVSVEHARKTAEEFTAAGIPSESIDGTQTDEHRASLLNRLKTGKIRVLTSCELIGEGIDIPAVTGAILLRPTASLGLHLQQIGRVLRPAPGKVNSIVIDHVGNLRKHGFAEDIRPWSLEGKTAKRMEGEKPVLIKQCTMCYAAHKPTASRQCPFCGHKYEIEARELKQKQAELEEIFRIEKRREQGRAQSFADLVAVGKQRGYKNPHYWARQVWTNRKS